MSSLSIYAAETYEDCQHTLKTLASKFFTTRRGIFQKIGKNQEDLESLADELFWKAYETHDDRLGPFQARLTFVVWNGMLDRFHTDLTAFRNRGEAKNDNNEDIGLDAFECRNRSRFSIPVFRAGLSFDATKAMQLALYPPTHIREKAEKVGGHPRNYRAAIRRYLIDDLGFTADEVRQCFAEVADKLETYDPDDRLDM